GGRIPIGPEATALLNRGGYQTSGTNIFPVEV
ncbi:unnamed protein product, partial [marine sediment metagenome]